MQDHSRKRKKRSRSSQTTQDVKTDSKNEPGRIRLQRFSECYEAPYGSSQPRPFIKFELQLSKS